MGKQSAFVNSCNVWLFRNIQTSQVLVSPSRILGNNRSMKQLPPNRRLHPTSLRKDHWVPLLKAQFPDSATMRQVYTRLLEYRTWRSQQPVPTEHRHMSVKARRRIEINQVATSVADLAASCASFAQKGAIIAWLNEEEKVYAKTWPANVTHTSGLDVIRGWSIVEDRTGLFSPESSASVAETVKS